MKRLAAATVIVAATLLGFGVGVWLTVRFGEPPAVGEIRSSPSFATEEVGREDVFGGIAGAVLSGGFALYLMRRYFVKPSL
jgi:hypothetical protein